MIEVTPKRNCLSGMYPVPMYIPERFVLEIEGRDENGRVKSKIVEVPEAMYNETEIGDEWEE